MNEDGNQLQMERLVSQALRLIKAGLSLKTACASFHSLRRTSSITPGSKLWTS